MPNNPTNKNKDAGTKPPSGRGPVDQSSQQDPNARLRPDQADNPNSKVNMSNKANPTKPQQVHDNNVNRPHSSS